MKWVNLQSEVGKLTKLQRVPANEVPYFTKEVGQLTKLQGSLTIEVPGGTYTSGEGYLYKWGT